MSIFLKASRNRSEPRIFHVRELCSVFGEDYAGILTTSASSNPLFSIYCTPDGYLLTAESGGLRINNERMEQGFAIPLGDGARFSFADWEFECLITSSLSEALAHSSASPAELSQHTLHYDKLPRVRYSLAGTGKSYPLFPKVTYVAGSSAHCAIYIPVDGVANSHCTFLFDGTSVAITTLDGKISVDQTEIDSNLILTSDSQVTLLPVGVIISLEFPNPFTGVKGGDVSIS